MKKKPVKLLIYAVIFILILVTILIILYLSPAGKKIIEKYVLKKFEIFSSFEVKNFNYEWNSFSVKLQKKDNTVAIYGNYFPFNASYNANFNDISEIDSNFRGSLTSDGSMDYQKNLLINGNAVLAGGYMLLKLKCSDKCRGDLNGSDFNTQKLFYMLNLHLPYFKGTNSLDVKLADNIKARFKYDGSFDFPPYVEIKNINIKGKVYIKNRETYKVTASFNSKKAAGNVSFLKENLEFTLQGNTGIELNILRNVVLYPVQTRKKVKFLYTNDGNFKFNIDKYITGFYNNSTLNIQLNSLNSKEFFKIINIEPFFQGVVNGNIVITGRYGNFDFFVENAKILKTGIIALIAKKTGIHTGVMNKMFIKGSFNRKKAVFNILAQNGNVIVNIQNGNFDYNGHNLYKIVITSNGNKYVFEIKNNKINKYFINKNPDLNKETLVY